MPVVLDKTQANMKVNLVQMLRQGQEGYPGPHTPCKV